jgi:hypothetical protein
MDVVFSSNGTYRINAYVDNEYTLNESSIISQKSQIRPFFINSVSNDPDVTGLTIFVQDPFGRTVSRKVSYILTSRPIERSDFPEEELYPGGGIRPEEGLPEEEVFPEQEYVSEEDGRSDEEIFPPAWEDPWNSPEYPASLDPSDLIDPLDPLDPLDPFAPSDPFVPSDPFAPSDPLAPSEPEVPSEPDVPLAPVISAGDESGAPRDVEIEIVLKRQKPKTEIPEAAIPEEIIYVNRLDEALPSFRVFEKLDIGQYNLIFQVMGKEEVLYKTYKPVYFLADAEFTLGDIQSYLPGISEGNQLIPPSIYIVLETKIAADERLDPYVVWYTGKKIISRGRVSERANCLLWKTPDQTGFHTIRAEVFPILPEETISDSIIGRVKELSLPISLKHEDMEFFTDTGEEFIHWYQFWGTLEDAKAPKDREKNLVSVLRGPAQWLPYEGVYGLSIGPKDIYAIPGSPFTLAENEQGRGRILFHFVPLTEGVIFNASFTQDPGPDDLIMEFSALQDGFVWYAGVGSEGYTETIPLNYLENSGFITVIIDFEIAGDQFSARLSLENPELSTEEVIIPLPGPMSGNGIFQFGAGTVSPAGGRVLEGRSASIGEEPLIDDSTAIINELALSYAVEVIPGTTPEDPIEAAGLPEEEKATEAVETEAVLAEEPEPSGEAEAGEKTANPTPPESVISEEGETSPELSMIDSTEKIETEYKNHL